MIRNNRELTSLTLSCELGRDTIFQVQRQNIPGTQTLYSRYTDTIFQVHRHNIPGTQTIFQVHRHNIPGTQTGFQWTPHYRYTIIKEYHIPGTLEDSHIIAGTKLLMDTIFQVQRYILNGRLI